MAATSPGFGAPGLPEAAHLMPSRRRTLATLAALCATTGCSRLRPAAVPPAPVRKPRPAQPPFPSVTGSKDALLLQVLAHPDDDLFFMNPDTQRMLRANTPVVCVYVTAGEALGLNRVPGAPVPTADAAGYSAARHQGLRQAYAEMMGLDRFARWQRSVLDLPGGIPAETNVLTSGGRKVQLIFLNIAMLSPHHVRLPHLWDVPGVEAHTLVAAGSPVRRTDVYHHRTLVDVLAGIMDRFRPTVIHTLDPDPDFQVHDAAHPRDNDQPGCSDHRDHTPVALFTWKAISQWVADSTHRDGHAPRCVTIAFRGYYNQRWPHNLPPTVVEEKARAVRAYGGGPDWECGDPAGCGDYSQGGNRPLTNRKGWVRSTHHRYPGAMAVPQTDRDGRLIVYGVLGAQAVRWRETAPGSGRFGTPADLGGGPLAPVVCAVKDAAGRQSLFALRFSALRGQGSENTREIVVREEQGGSFTPWTPLGTPDDDPELGRRVGCPAAIATPDGRVHLFVRTAGKGVATRVRDALGHWGPWLALGGGEVQDGLTVLLGRAGRVHVFAAGHDTVHHWAQTRPGGPTRYRPTSGLPCPADRPGAALAADGSPVLVYRGPASAQPHLHPAGSGAHGRSAPALRHFEGYGPVTAHVLPGQGDGGDTTVLLGRALDGEVQLHYGTAPDSPPLRAPVQLLPVGEPGLWPAPEGQLCVVGLTPGATPWLWRPRRASTV